MLFCAGKLDASLELDATHSLTHLGLSSRFELSFGIASSFAVSVHIAFLLA